MTPESSLFVAFCTTAEAVGGTASRLEKARLLGEYFTPLHDEDLRRAALYFGGYLFPLREGRTVNIGGSALFSSLQEVSGAEEDFISARLVARGDFGDVAEEVWAQWTAVPSEPNLTLADVEAAIAELAATAGSLKKKTLVQETLRRCTALEAKYWVKMLQGDLRIGLREGAVEDALARLAAQSVAAVQRANMLTGDLGEVALLARHGRLNEAVFQLFHPPKIHAGHPRRRFERCREADAGAVRGGRQVRRYPRPGASGAASATR